MNASEPRGHHFVPQCWLVGFTEDGEKTGKLWVTDLDSKKQWQSIPPKVGRQRDLYRLDEGTLDPVIFEKHFSNLEGEVAPLLKSMYDKPRWPTPEELAILEVFIAFQYVRVPAFRPLVLKLSKRIHRNWMAKVLKSPKAWESALRMADIPPESKGASYKEMREFINSDDYSISANNDWFLMRGVKAAVDAILPALQNRYWATLISSTGSFVGSDNPVTLDGPEGQLTGFVSADVVLFPVNKCMLLGSMKSSRRAPRMTYSLIARHNTFAMMNGRYIYSPVPNFVWLDEADKCQTDFTLFDRKKFPTTDHSPKDK